MSYHHPRMPTSCFGDSGCVSFSTVSVTLTVSVSLPVSSLLLMSSLLVFTLLDSVGEGDRNMFVVPGGTFDLIQLTASFFSAIKQFQNSYLYV